MSTSDLLRTPLHDLHLELGARMVPFADYSMPVQYKTGLLNEHHHTRQQAGLFDVSHMGQLRLKGANAAQAFETLVPVDVVGLPPGKQRYGLLLNDAGSIMDDLMFVNRGEDLFVVVNGACKNVDIHHIQDKVGHLCEVTPLTNHALLALQGPQAINALQRLVPLVGNLLFMNGAQFSWRDVSLFITRSGYTGEDGFEISLAAEHAEVFARELLDQPEVLPIGLGARNSLRLEAGLCLYGNDIDQSTTPAEANLAWAIQKVRRENGARQGGFPGAQRVLEQLNGTQPVSKLRVGLIGTERIPVREPAELFALDGAPVGHVTSGLLSPTLNKPIALAYVSPAYAAMGQQLHAMVRGKPVLMSVSPLPFVPNRYYRG